MSSALALVAAKNGFKPTVWFHSEQSFSHFQHTGESSYLPGKNLRDNGVLGTNSLEEALEGAKLTCWSPRAKNFVETIQNAKPFINIDIPRVTATKGFIFYNGLYLTPSEILEAEIPGSKSKTVTLSGPNFADQIAKGKISGTTIAGYDSKAVSDVWETFHNPLFRVDQYQYRPKDLELVGGYKNIVGLIMGFVRTLDEYDENAGALVLQKGLEEAAELCVATGGTKYAIMELCGVGDYGLLMNSTTSRNVEAGEDFGSGKKTLDQIKNSEITIEGVEAAKAVPWFCKQFNIRLPLGMAAYRVLYKNKDPKLAVNWLLAA